MHLRWLAALLAVSTPGLAAAAESTEFTLGGYVKLDAMFSEYGGGAPSDGSLLRDFLLPGAIPVGGVSEDASTDFHAKESRFNAGLRRQTGDGHALDVFLEIDFLLSPSGDERVSNSYSPRLRHAWLSFDDWLFGQTWSTFMIVVLPEDLDFIGVPEGTTFQRGAQIRLTRGAWQFALENPETTITPNGGGARISANDGLVPELVARYNAKRERGTISVAGLLRRLELETGAIDSTTSGWGLSVGGQQRLGRSDELLFMITSGSGLGRYLALNTANAAGVTAGGELEAIDSTAGFIGLRHEWNERWRSSVNVSIFSSDHDVTITGGDVTRHARSYSVNALYSPLPDLTLGVEYMHAEREIASGAEGDLDRIQFSAKYAFKVPLITRAPKGP
jgi:hypothetical protein